MNVENILSNGGHEEIFLRGGGEKVVKFLLPTRNLENNFFF